MLTKVTRYRSVCSSPRRPFLPGARPSFQSPCNRRTGFSSFPVSLLLLLPAESRGRRLRGRLVPFHLSRTLSSPAPCQLDSNVLSWDVVVLFLVTPPFSFLLFRTKKHGKPLFPHVPSSLFFQTVKFFFFLPSYGIPERASQCVFP